jgi:hypothetical protein
MGEKLQDLKPREAENFTWLRGQPREAKPFTRMAKWEIRFQRFALSSRTSALDVCCFRLSPSALVPDLCQYSGLTSFRFQHYDFY